MIEKSISQFELSQIFQKNNIEIEEEYVDKFIIGNDKNFLNIRYINKILSSTGWFISCLYDGEYQGNLERVVTYESFLNGEKYIDSFEIWYIEVF